MLLLLMLKFYMFLHHCFFIIRPKRCVIIIIIIMKFIEVQAAHQKNSCPLRNCVLSHYNDGISHSHAANYHRLLSHVTYQATVITQKWLRTVNEFLPTPLPNFSHWETLPVLQHGRHITDSRQTSARVM